MTPAEQGQERRWTIFVEDDGSMPSQRDAPNAMPVEVVPAAANWALVEALREPLELAADRRYSTEFVGNVFRSRAAEIRAALDTVSGDVQEGER